MSDFSQDCNSFAGPTAGSVEDCYSVDLATCDAIKQDECTYTGERLSECLSASADLTFNVVLPS